MHETVRQTHGVNALSRYALSTSHALSEATMQEKRYVSKAKCPHCKENTLARLHIPNLRPTAVKFLCVYDPL